MTSAAHDVLDESTLLHLVALERYLQSGTGRAQTFAVEPWIAAWCAAIAPIATRRIGRTTRLARSTSTPPASIAEHAAYAVQLRRAEGAEPLTICLDQAACRACVDALLHDITSLRGAGNLSACELGALDFITAELLDDVAGSAVEPWSIHATAVGPAARGMAQALLATRTLHAIPLTIGVAAVRGHLLVGIPRDLRARLPDSTPQAAAPDHACLRVRLGLPPVELSAVEADELEAGDLLLLPMSQLAGVRAGMTLVAAGGADVADVVVRSDEPTVCSVEIVRINARLRPTPPAEGVVRVRALIGACDLPVASLRSLAAGTIVDLVKPEPDVVVELTGAGGSRGVAGRLVRRDGQLAVRLLERPTATDAKPPRTHP